MKNYPLKKIEMRKILINKEETNVNEKNEDNIINKTDTNLNLSEMIIENKIKKY